MTAAGPILLVEDNPDDVLLTRKAFAKCGFENEILSVPDGEECLSVLLPETGASIVRPVLVLLDLSLPKVGGLEVLSRLRADERTWLLPVVILSTSHDRRDILDGYLLGANSYICKPASFARFTAMARALGVYWLTVNEPCPDPEDVR